MKRTTLLLALLALESFKDSPLYEAFMNMNSKEDGGPVWTTEQYQEAITEVRNAAVAASENA